MIVKALTSVYLISNNCNRYLKKYNAFNSFALENKDILLVICSPHSEDSPVLREARRNY